MNKVTMIIWALLCYVSTFASSITHTLAVFPSTTDWNITNSVPRFDPILGTLTNVTIDIGVNGATVAKVESLSNLRRTITAGSHIFATATAAGHQVSSTLTNTHTQVVSGFDGTVDFAGTSGFTVNVLGSASASASPQDFTPFIGAGTIPLVVSAVANGFYRGPADYNFVVATSASALVSVTYEFTQKCPPRNPKDCDDDEDDDDEDDDDDRDCKTSKDSKKDGRKGHRKTR